MVLVRVLVKGSGHGRCRVNQFQGEPELQVDEMRDKLNVLVSANTRRETHDVGESDQ